MRQQFSIAENRDCMAAMREFPDKFFELAVVDPPYGIGEDGKKNHSRGKPTSSNGKKSASKAVVNTRNGRFLNQKTR